jgi:hypothetical protein
MSISFNRVVSCIPVRLAYRNLRLPVPLIALPIFLALLGRLVVHFLMWKLRLMRNWLNQTEYWSNFHLTLT